MSGMIPEEMGCVQFAGDDVKSRPVSLIAVTLSTWFEFCAVGEEGHISRTLCLPQVHIRVEGHYRPSLSSTLGNDEIESYLKRDRLIAKIEFKILLLGAGESGKVRR